MFSLIHLHIPVVHSQQHVTTAPRLDTLPFDEAGYVLLVIEDKTLELLLKRLAAQMKGGCSRGAPYRGQLCITHRQTALQSSNLR